MYLRYNAYTLTSVGTPAVQWISVALENSVERVSCPDNKQYTLLILSGHETSSTEFSNATEIRCKLLFLYRLIPRQVGVA